MRKRVLSLLLTVLFACLSATCNAGYMVSTTTGGDWNDPSTWVGGSIPGFNDSAVITPGATVTVTSDLTVSVLAFDNTGSSTGRVVVNSGITLTVRGYITAKNSATNNTSAALQGGGTINSTTVTVGGTVSPGVAYSDFYTTLTCTVSNLSTGKTTISALYNSSLSAANQGVLAIASGTVTVDNTITFATVPIFGPILTLATGTQDGTLATTAGTPFAFSGGGSYTFTPNGTNATVDYAGSAQPVLAATYHNLFLSGSGTKATTGATVNGTLSMRGTATASAAPTYGANSTLEYNGSTAQTSGPELVANLPSLRIDNVSGVTLAGSTTIGTSLSLVNGILTTGTNPLNLGASASVSGGSASSYVNGSVQKTFSTGTGSLTFPIGDSSSYAPVTVDNLAVTSSGALKAATTAGSHPQFGTSGLDPDRSVNRYWMLTQSGGAFGTYNATFNYPASEVDSNAVPSQFTVRQWNGSVWTATTVSGTPTSTSASVSGQSGFGDFAIGNPSPWYNGAWSHRIAITIDHNKVAGTLTNFPVLISLTNTALQQYAQTNGNDLLFTSNDGTTKLAHEIESYTGSNGALVAWVKVPILSSSTDTVLYLYYGNASATNQQNATSVWDSNFMAVWHLKEDRAGTGNLALYKDSTANGNNGDDYVSSTSKTGEIGNGQGFNGTNDYIEATNSASLTITQKITLSAWVNYAAFAASHGYAYIVGKGYGRGIEPFYLRNENMSSNVLVVGSYDQPNDFNTSWTISGWNTNEWHFVVGLYDGTNWQIYVDGVLKASTANATGPLTSTWPVTIGAWDNGGAISRFSNAHIDEVRISDTARSADWIATEYNNQYSPATFYNVGSPESETTSPTTLAITSVNGGSSPAVGTAFDVVIQAQDGGGTPQNVQSNTAVSLSLNTGTGTLGGTLNGIIPAGTNFVTISGLTYTKAESGVSLTATRTSGDNLTAGNSSPFSVNPGNQTITFPSPGNQTYGIGPITLNATASSGLAVSYSVTSGPATVSSNQLTITGAGSVTILASQAGNANWNAALPTNQTISVAQKTVIGSITVNNKTYDGTLAATIATRTLSGVTNSDVVSLTGGTATFADQNVGNGKTVIATGLSLSGTNAGNYVLASTSATNIANITAATIIASADDASRPYGTANPVFTASYSGFVNGESTNVISGSPVLTTTATTNSPVGDYPIEISQGTLSSVNYIFSLTNGTLTITAVAPVLTINLTGMGTQTNGVSVFCAGLTPNNTYYMDASTNLTQWQQVATLQAASDGTITYTETNLALYLTRFYRLSGN